MKNFEFWYDDNQKHANFCHKLLRFSEQETDEYFDILMDIIKKKRKQIKKLRNTTIEVIKKDIDQKLYQSLLNANIRTMLDLANSIWVSPHRGVMSKLPNVGKVKGEKLANAMYKNGFPCGRDLIYEQEKNETF